MARLLELAAIACALDDLVSLAFDLARQLMTLMGLAAFPFAVAVPASEVACQVPDMLSLAASSCAVLSSDAPQHMAIRQEAS